MSKDEYRQEAYRLQAEEIHGLREQLDAYNDHMCISGNIAPIMFLVFTIGCVCGRIIKRVT